MKRTTYDLNWIRVSALQWVFFFALGSALPFFGLFYKKVLIYPNGDIAHYYIGLIFSIQAIVGIFGTPVAGIIADKFKISSRLLTICSLMVAVSSIIIALPGIPFFSNLSFKQKFLCILGGIIINGFFYAPVIPLIDTETLNYLHNKYNTGEKYGRIRVFGTMGWIFSPIIFGYLLTLTGKLYIAVVGYGIGFFILALIALSGVNPDIKAVTIPLERLRHDKMYQKFLVFVFIFSFAFTSSFNFTSYFFDDAKVSFLIMGLAFGLAAVPEIPLMFNSHYFINKIGNRWMIIIGVFIEFLKLISFIVLSQVSNKNLHYLYIVAQSLHGVGFSLFFSGEINLIDRLAHKDLRATYQNLFHLVWTLSATIAGFTGAMIVKHLSSTWLMGIDSALFIIAIIYFYLFVKGHGPTTAGTK